MSATIPAPTAVPTTAPPRATLRTWVGLAVLVLPTLLVAIDNTVLSIALPAITAALEPSATALLWIVDIYPLVLAGLLVTMGTVGDRIGRRRLLMIGVAGFGAVSFLAAFATSGAQLIVARLLLGIFGSMLMPATLALLRSLFLDPAQRRFAVAVWAAGFAGGAAAGPLLGGVLLEHFWWGSVFLVNTPVLLAILVTAPLVLVESRNPTAGRLDLVGVVLSMATMVPAVYAIKMIGHDGLGRTAVLLLAVAAAAGVAFVRRANVLIAAGRDPLIDVRLFSAPVLRFSALANAASMFAFTGLLFFSAQYLTLVVGLSPLQTGFVLLPGCVTTMIAGMVASRLARVLPLHVLIPAGLLVAAAAFLLCVRMDESSVGLLVVASVVFGAGIGISETITNDAILGAAPADRAGSASAVSETAYEVGAVLGTAVLGSVLSAVYRATVEVPAGALSAQETLGGAVTLAGQLPTPVAEPLLASARAAFVAGIDVTAAVGAASLAAVAVAVYLALRPR